MEYYYPAIAVFLVSLVVILFLCFHVVKLHKITAELRSAPRPQSIELKEFLADMMVGEALIAVSRIDPNNLYIHSPRDKQ